MLAHSYFESLTASFYFVDGDVCPGASTAAQGPGPSLSYWTVPFQKWPSLARPHTADSTQDPDSP